MKNEKLKLKEELPALKENISLSKYTTFKIGGPAKYFLAARTRQDVIRAIETAKKYNLPFFILGGGSNLLVADKGYEGLVVKIQNSKSKCQIKSKAQNSKIYTGAGTPLSLIVSVATENNLAGLEWAVGIPGTIGGAVRGNAGAFGESIKDVIKEVEAYDIEGKKIKIFKNKDCKFNYRESVFKKKKNLFIVSVRIQLKKGKAEEIQEKIKDYSSRRRETQPLNFPSAGSVFKNYELRIKNYEFINDVPRLSEFKKKGVIPAGYLIEKCGLKGKRINQAQISKKHANFIINLGGAKAEDVLKLIKLAQKKVKEKFGITLKEEVQFLGF